MNTTPPSLRIPFELEPIQTERLLLRPMRATDAADVYSYMGLEVVMRYWGPSLTVQQAEEYVIERGHKTTLENDADILSYAIEVEKPSVTGSRVIGEIRMVLASAKNAQLDIGWILHPDFQGHGYATEAARPVLDACFTKVGAHRVVAGLYAQNLGSARVAERLGLVLDGVLRDSSYSETSHEWQSAAIYSILAEEFASRKVMS